MNSSMDTLTPEELARKIRQDFARSGGKSKSPRKLAAVRANLQRANLARLHNPTLEQLCKQVTKIEKELPTVENNYSPAQPTANT